MFDQLLQVAGDVLLKLRDGFGAEDMGEDFTFAGMVRSIAGAEKGARDGDESVVVVA